MSTRFRQTFGSSVGAHIFSLKKSWNIQSMGLSSKKSRAWVMNCRRSSDLKSFPMKPSSENSKTIQGFHWFFNDFFFSITWFNPGSQNGWNWAVYSKLNGLQPIWTVIFIKVIKDEDDWSFETQTLNQYEWSILTVMSLVGKTAQFWSFWPLIKRPSCFESKFLTLYDFRSV